MALQVWTLSLLVNVLDTELLEQPWVTLAADCVTGNAKVSCKLVTAALGSPISKLCS